MKIQTILSPGPTAQREDFQRLSLAEEKVLWQHYAQGRLREMYFQQDPIRVVLVWEAADLTQVKQFLDTFPMIQAGLFTTEFIALGPWVPLLALFRDDVVSDLARS